MIEKIPHIKGHQTWCYFEFGEICKIIGGSQPPKKEFVFEPISGYIRLIQIRDYKSDNHLTFIPESKAKRFCSVDDVMIGRYGPPIFQILRGIEGAYNVALMKACPIDKRILDNEYLYYFLHNQTLRNYVIFHSTRTAGQDGVRKELLQEYPIYLPPLNEQKRIVTKIEALQTRSTAVKEELEAIKPLLNQFRQSVLASAFRGDLTKDWREQNPDVEPASKNIKSNSDLASNNLPINWCQTLVGNVVENLKYGTSKKCSYKVDGVPVLRIPNIVDGTINHSDLKYAELPDKEYDKLKLISGDILMIRSNGSASLVGRTAIIGEAERDFAYAGYLIRLRPNKNLVYPEYLNLWFSSHEIRLQIEIPLRSTSGVNNINSDETKKLNIPLAPISEQKEIVRRIESLFKLADSIANQQSKIQNQIETLNQSILAKAFRGELVPQDSNDEPASVLLERIREERDKVKPKKSKTKKKRSSKKQDKQLGIPGI